MRLKFDVCILPYLVHRGGQSAESVTMYEYLATSKHVVASTDACGIERFSHLIRIAKNYDEFIHHVDEPIDEKRLFTSSGTSGSCKKE